MPELKEEIEQLGKNFEEFKKANDQLIEDKAKGIVNSALEEKVEKLNVALSQSEEALKKAQAAQESAEQVELAFKRQGPAGKTLSQEEQLHKQAFSKILMNKALTPEETHAMSSYSDPDGGYTVPIDFDKELTRDLKETSPMRQVAKVKTTNTDQYEKPQRIGRVGARWKDREKDGGETSTPKYDKLTLRIHELEAEPKIPINLINDSAIDIVADVREAVVEEFTLSENTAFVKGDGQGQPTGFLNYPEGSNWREIERIASGNTSQITSDAVLDMITALKSGYRSGAVFLANRRTIGEIRKLKDGQGNYLWQPNYQSGQPFSLAGYPLMEFDDMPDIAANAQPIAFGDFRRAYIIIDRMGTRVLVNPYKENGYIFYYTTKRVGGGIDNFEALKIMKIAN